MEKNNFRASYQLDEFYLDLQSDGNTISVLDEEKILKNPFPGLRPFSTSEFQLFQGREEQCNELIKLFKKNRFLAVIGSSGTGKSSLVRAGLIPQLLGGYFSNEGRKWKIAICRPGKNPIANLGIALANLYEKDNSQLQQSYGRFIKALNDDIYGIVEINDEITERYNEKHSLLIIVDQFEELFRINRAELENENIENHFVNLLLQSATIEDYSIYVLITMRSEFLGDCVRYKYLPEAINKGQYLVPQLSRPQLIDAIEGPVKCAGKKIDRDLVELLINELDQNNLKENQDQLPILQHALMSTYKNALADPNTKTISIRHYRAEKVGGMEKALNLHAEEVYQALGDPAAPRRETRKQKIARVIFQALTEENPDQKGGRRFVELKDIHAVAKEKLGVEKAEVNDVIEQFRDENASFIIPAKTKNSILRDDLMLDISHESLMRQWVRLKEWIREESESRGIYERLVESSNLNKKEEKNHLRGRELYYTRKWYRDNKIGESWAKRYDKLFEKVYNGTNYNDAIKYLKKSSFTSRRNIGSLLVAALVILCLGIWWMIVTKNSTDNFSNALKEKFYNPTKALQLEDKALKYFVLAKAGLEPWNLIKEDAENILLNEAFYFYKPVIESPKDSFTAFAFNIISEKEYQVIAANKRGQIFLWKRGEKDSLDSSKPQITGSLKSPLINDTVTCIAFSPDKTRVLTATQKGFVILYNIENARLTELQRFETDVNDPLISVAISGTKAVAGSLNGKLRIWSIGENGKNFKAHQDSIRVYWRPKHINKGDLSDAGIISVSFLPRRENQRMEYVLVGALNDTVKLINCTNPEIIDTYTDPQSRSRFNEIRVVVSPQPGSTLFLTCGNNGIVNLWDYDKAMTNPVNYTTAKPDKSFEVTKNGISAVAFSPDGGHFIISNAVNNNLSLYALNGNLEQELKGGHDDAVRSIAFSPDGKSVFTGSADNTVKIWRTNGKLITDKHADYQSPFTATAIIPDSAGKIITGDFNGYIEVFDADKRIRERKKIADTAITCLAYSSESKLIFSSSAKGEITLIRYDGSKIGDSTKQNFRDNIFSAVFFDNGKKLLTGSINAIKLWSIEGDTLRFIQRFYDKKNQNFKPLSIDFLNTDSLLFVTGAENPGIARFWKINSDTPVGKFPINLKAAEYFQNVKFSRDGKKILVSTNKNYAYLLEYDKTGDIIINNTRFKERQIKSPVYETNAVAFSFTGDTLITGSGNGKIRYWDANTLKPITEFQADIEAIQSLELSKNGDRLLSRSQTSVKLWNVSNPSFEKFLNEKNIDALKEEK